MFLFFAEVADSNLEKALAFSAGPHVLPKKSSAGETFSGSNIFTVGEYPASGGASS